MEAVTGLGQGFFGAGLPVDQHDHVPHEQTRAGQFFDGFEFAAAGGGQVVDDDDGLAGLVFSFDLGFRAVSLDLLAGVDHGVATLQGDGAGDGDGGVRQAGQAGKLQFLQDGQIGLADECQQGRVADDAAQVDVDGRDQAGFEGEFAKLDAAAGEQTFRQGGELRRGGGEGLAFLFPFFLTQLILDIDDLVAQFGCGCGGIFGAGDERGRR